MVDVLKLVTTKLGNKIYLLGNKDHNGILIVGVVHGDEPQGEYLISQYLKHNPNSKHMFIPCLNPDGMQLNTRTNANRVDINRNFPTKNWGQNCGDNATCDDDSTAYFGGKSPASEIETQFLIDTIEKYHPKLVLTLHTPYKTVNYDGPAKQIAQMIADIIKYPVEESIGYPTPGSFGTWAGVERNIPAITLEMDEICPVEELITPIFKIFDLLSIEQITEKAF